MQVEINGQLHEYQGEPERPLLWYLRDGLGLRGSKYGCGKGLCGACTVQVDGSAVRSCVTPMGGLAGRRITTIEGLADTADGSDLHPVQQAWMDLDVPQCGYCQAGQIMQTASLLAADPDISVAGLEQGLGNLCRCGTQYRIRKALVRARELHGQVQTKREHEGGAS